MAFFKRSLTFLGTHDIYKGPSFMQGYHFNAAKFCQNLGLCPSQPLHRCLVSRGTGARPPVAPARATLAPPSIRPSPGVPVKSHVHIGQFAFDSVIIWGNWTEWDELSEETGRSQPGFPAHLPTPTFCPRNSAVDRACPGTAWQAGSSQGHSRASLLSPQLPLQGLGPSVHAGSQGKQVRQHTARRRAVRGFKLSQPR